MASLFIVRGRDQGRHIQLSDSKLRIGREVDSEIQLTDTEVSRQHAEISSSHDGNYTLLDLGSSNGTMVNGERIDNCQLVSGDRIELGTTLIVYTGSSNPASVEQRKGVDVVLSSDDQSQIVSSLSPTAGAFGETSSRHEPLDRSSINSPSVNSSPFTQSESDRSLEVMYLTAIAVGRTDELNEVLDRVLHLVFDWVEADRGCVMLLDNETGQLEPAARRDREGASSSIRGRQISISRTIVDYVIENKQGVRTSNARSDERFDSAASIVQGRVCEALCVPLQGRYGVVGALYVDTHRSRIESAHQDQFNDDHLRLITAIGHQAALAIEDTFYYSAVVQSERLAAMGQTIAMLSHHVKNILQGMRGGSYLIEAGVGSRGYRRGTTRLDNRRAKPRSNLEFGHGHVDLFQGTRARACRRRSE